MILMSLSRLNQFPGLYLHIFSFLLTKSELDEIDVVSTDTKSPPGLLQSQATSPGEETQPILVPKSDSSPDAKPLKSSECYCNKVQDALAVWCEKCKQNFHIG